MAVEIELKTRIDEPEAMEKRLEERGTGEGAYEKEDVYWFFAGKGDERGPGLPPSGLRVRRETNTPREGEGSSRTLVTYKIRDLREGVEINDEREFEVSGAGVFEDLLRRLGLAPGIGKHKRGRAWVCETGTGTVRAELSEVRGLGWYLELEVLAAPGDEAALAAARAGLFSLLETLEIPRERIETRPYTEMLRALEKNGKYGHTSGSGERYPKTGGWFLSETKDGTYRRPSWDEYFMEVCDAISKRATCDRGRSGCVIAKDNQILVTGYVGAPRGLPHCDEAGHQLKKMIHEDGSVTTHCVRTVHAEQNAICQAAKRGIALEGATLYCRMTPCRTCAMLIINCGIVRVVCQRRYHDGEDSEAMFARAGISLEYVFDEIQEYEKQ